MKGTQRTVKGSRALCPKGPRGVLPNLETRASEAKDQILRGFEKVFCQGNSKKGPGSQPLLCANNSFLVGVPLFPGESTSNEDINQRCCQGEPQSSTSSR